MAYIGRYNSSNIVDLKSPVSVDGVPIIGSGGTIENATLGSSVTFPAGHVGIKSYSITNSNYWSGNATSETELFTGSGGFTSAVITPTSSTSKFLIIGFFGSATTAQTNRDYTAGFFLVRSIAGGAYDYSDIIGENVGVIDKVMTQTRGWAYNLGHTGPPINFSGIDAPAHNGNTVTYRINYQCQSGSYALIMNGTPDNVNAAGIHRAQTTAIMNIIEIV